MLRACVALLSGILLLCGCAHAGVKAAPIALTDDAGRPWTLADHAGDGNAVFFGYTHCADTCPATLAKLAQALREAGTQASHVRIDFITVDPQRDTVAALHAYVAKFGRAVVGLTGTPAQIAATERAYHVWAQKVPGNHGDDGYDESHTSAVFFIDKHGNVASIHDDTDSFATLKSAIEQVAS